VPEREKKAKREKSKREGEKKKRQPLRAL